MGVRTAKKAIRSVLVRFPRIYDVVTSQWRYRALHRFGIVHEYEFKAFPLLTDRADALVLDVGGNNGQSILSIKTVLPAARVITFEPARRHHESLRALAAQLDSVTIEPFALAKEDGEADLYWPVYNGMPMHALASLDRAEAENWLDPTNMYGFDPSLQSMESERVVMRRLDGLGLDPDIIKIDVQGTEPDVIEGGLETIRRNRPAIMAEALVEGGPAATLLEPLGYGIYTFRNGAFEPGADSSATNHFLIGEDRLRASSNPS